MLGTWKAMAAELIKMQQLKKQSKGEKTATSMERNSKLKNAKKKVSPTTVILPSFGTVISVTFGFVRSKAVSDFIKFCTCTISIFFPLTISSTSFSV